MNKPTPPASPKKPEPFAAVHTKETAAPNTLPPGADLEERIEAFFKENISSLILSVAVAAVIVVGVQIYRYWSASHEEKVRASFGAAQSLDEWLAFARDHSSDPLAGLASFKAGNELYRQGRYAEAIPQYEAALKTVTDGPVTERVRFARAMATLLANPETSSANPGVADLQLLFDDANALQSVRAEAGYQIAVWQWQQDRPAEAIQALDKIETLPKAGLWLDRAAQLRQQIPAPPPALQETPAPTAP